MRRKLLLGLGASLLAIGAWVWFGPLGAWRSIERVPFDPAAAREVLSSTQTTPPADAETLLQPSPTVLTIPPPPATTITSQPPESTPPVSRVDTAAHDVFLILGSDEKPNDDDVRADAIMLLIVPDDRSASLLVSVPRALYVNSPCTNELAPINTNLEGCGPVGGLDLMGVAVEDYTGLEIDHLVLFEFDGFRTIVDRIGGLEVCVENAIKLKAEQRTFLEPGCSTLDGRQALRWVRSRQTLEQIDGEWTLMEGAGDAARTERQRDLVRQVMAQADEFNSPGALLSILSELSDSFILDDDLDLGEAIDLAWDLRTLGRKPMLDLSVKGTGGVSPDGQFILTPDEPFAVYLAALDDG